MIAWLEAHDRFLWTVALAVSWGSYLSADWRARREKRRADIAEAQYAKLLDIARRQDAVITKTVAFERSLVEAQARARLRPN